MSYDVYLKLILGLQHSQMAYNLLYSYADDAESLQQISALCCLEADTRQAACCIRSCPDSPPPTQ